MTVKTTRRASKRASASGRQKAVRKRTSLKADALYQELFASSLDGILLIDAETQRVIEFNDAACRQLGYTRDEFVGLRIADYEASKTSETIDAHVQEAFREGKTEFDTLQRTKTGEIRHVHVWARPFDLDGRVVLYAIFRDITEHKQAMEAARRSEARCRALTESAPAAIITADSGGNVEGWNHAAEIVFGYTAAEIIGQPLTRLMPYRYRERHLLGMNRIQSGGEPHVIGKTVELEGLRKDQSEFPLELSLARWETSEGWFVSGIIRDITERRRAAEESQMVLRTAMDGFWVVDVQGRLLEANEAYCRLVGYTRDELLAMRISDIEAAESSEATAAHIAAIMRTGSDRFVTRHRRKDGAVLDVEVSVNYLPLNGGRIFVFVRDVTEHNRAEAALRLQSAALHAAADAIVITDRAAVIEWVNPAFTQLTGYTAEEALGKNPRDLVKSGKHDQPFYKDFWETILAGRPWHGEMINRRKDGGLYTEEQAVTPILDASGAITHFVAIKEDMTGRLQLEAQFR